MIPIENYGVKCMSMGSLVENEAPIVWRGPMVCQNHVLFIYIFFSISPTFPATHLTNGLKLTLKSHIRFFSITTTVLFNYLYIIF